MIKTFVICGIKLETGYCWSVTTQTITLSKALLIGNSYKKNTDIKFSAHDAFLE